MSKFAPRVSSALRLIDWGAPRQKLIWSLKKQEPPEFWWLLRKEKLFAALRNLLLLFGTAQRAPAERDDLFHVPSPSYGLTTSQRPWTSTVASPIPFACTALARFFKKERKISCRP